MTFYPHHIRALGSNERAGGTHLTGMQFYVRRSVSLSSAWCALYIHTVTNVAANNNGTEEAAIHTLQPNQLTRAIRQSGLQHRPYTPRHLVITEEIEKNMQQVQKCEGF